MTEFYLDKVILLFAYHANITFSATKVRLNCQLFLAWQCLINLNNVCNTSEPQAFRVYTEDYLLNSIFIFLFFHLITVREVTLSELRDSVARLRDRVKLVCRTRGSPPPQVHWLKDGVPLHPRRGLRIQHKRWVWHNTYSYYLYLFSDNTDTHFREIITRDFESLGYILV